MRDISTRCVIDPQRRATFLLESVKFKIHLSSNYTTSFHLTRWTIFTPSFLPSRWVRIRIRVAANLAPNPNQHSPTQPKIMLGAPSLPGLVTRRGRAPAPITGIISSSHRPSHEPICCRIRIKTADHLLFAVPHPWWLLHVFGRQAGRQANLGHHLAQLFSISIPGLLYVHFTQALRARARLYTLSQADQRRSVPAPAQPLRRCINYGAYSVGASMACWATGQRNGLGWAALNPVCWVVG